MSLSLTRRIARRFAVTVLLAGLGLFIVYLFMPRPALYGDTPWSRAYLDRDGHLLRLTLAADDRYRLRVPLRMIAPTMVQATLLYEDKHYYTHPGVNPAALLRAAWTTFITRDRRVGASTITMQLARLRFDLDTRRISGKLTQIFRALQLERHYSKTEILEAYFALAPYGRNIEGIAAASLVYFGKPANRLTLPESLSLAVIPQNPTARNPSDTNGRTHLLAARLRLFSDWQKNHPEDGKRASQLDLPLTFRVPEQLPFTAPHLTQRLEETLPSSQVGQIQTTLSRETQRLVESHIHRYIAQHAPVGIDNAVALLINHTTMNVEAYVGSADFFRDAIQGQVDGIRARRSPGSALKPFVYALAMDQGLIHPMSLLKDAPRRFGGYTPENFDQTFLGPVLAKDALTLSRNVPAVQLAKKINNPDLYAFLQQTGIPLAHARNHYGLAIALGGLEVTMEELVGLYALLANAGHYRTPRYLLAQPSDRGQTFLSPEASFLTLDMLSETSPPSEALLPGQVRSPLPVAWKTGTSYGFRDAWSIGTFGPYVLAIWVGRFDGAGNPAYVGRKAAGPLFFNIARAIAYAKGPFHPTTDPNHLNLAKVAVCAPTGDLPNPHCPQTKSAWFIPGVSPLKVSAIHRAIPIDTASGKRACFHEPPNTHLAVYEFWPSDLLALFQAAGITRKRPPAFKQDCPLDVASYTGAPPDIRAPDPNIIYTLQSRHRDQEKIPFSAVTDADATTLHWFVDDRYIGQAARGETLLWKPDVGRFNVRVVDDQGRAAMTRLHVKLIN